MGNLVELLKGQDTWIDRETMKSICPNCHDLMVQKHIKKIKLSAVLKKYISQFGKQARDPNAVCGALWFNGTEAQREAFGSGTEGRGTDERPPKEWFDDCLDKIE